jgi:hypothetical protein
MGYSAASGMISFQLDRTVHPGVRSPRGPPIPGVLVARTSFGRNRSAVIYHISILGRSRGLCPAWHVVLLLDGIEVQGKSEDALSLPPTVQV